MNLKLKKISQLARVIGDGYLVKVYTWKSTSSIIVKFQKLYEGSGTLDMTSEGLVEMFKGDSADMCAEKFQLVLMGG